MRRLFALVLLSWFSCFFLSAQEYSGVLIGHSTQKVGPVDFNFSYTYKTYSFQYLKSAALLKSKSVALNWEVNPQFSIVTKTEEALDHGKPNSGIEAAILLGLTGRVQVLPWWQSYIGISIGPQYISNPPSRQKKGFIFSDNAFWGNQLQISPDYSLDLRLGIRHQSNASLGQPNGGIDSLFLSFGIQQIL